MIIPSPRPEIQKLAPVHHGAFDFGELDRLRLSPESVLDFSVNSNPFGPSPAVAAAISAVALDRYPDREAIGLRNALSARLGLTLDQIVAGNGTSELLALVSLAYIRPGDVVLLLTPTYGEYARAAAQMGAVVETVWAAEDREYRHDFKEVGGLLRQHAPRLVFVCNPNNPTGAVIPLDVLESWAAANLETLFVVDEAYRQFVPGLESALSIGAPNLLVLASMTKDYALAGLRLGYAVGHPEVVAALASVRPPWNVNALALAAGLAALEDEAHLRETLGELWAARDALFSGLAGLGYRLIPSETHYGLVRVGNGAKFRARLLKRGFQIRDCASFGLPGYVRIATRLPGENRRLLTAIEEMIE